MKKNNFFILFLLFSLVLIPSGMYIGASFQNKECNLFIQEKIDDGTFIMPFRPERQQYNFNFNFSLNESLS